MSNTTDISVENIISNAIKIPGVKVDRKRLFAEVFSSYDIDLQTITRLGPIDAGISREELWKIANKLILTRTSASSIMSFAAGLPGGWAMAATIPADVIQFFAIALRLAQELSYLYGAKDLWNNGKLDNEKVMGQLLLYCGVMFGAAHAEAGVRILAAQMAKAVLKQLPKKALMKQFWYRLVKQIGKALSIRVTKAAVAQGLAKAIPVVGGVISGGLNFASLYPMSRRLLKTFDKAAFEYTEEDMNADLQIIDSLNSSEEQTPPLKDKESEPVEHPNTVNSSDDIFAKIEKLAGLKEMGAITEEEFSKKKAELLARI